METKRIKVIVAHKKTKDGKAFDTYKTFSKNGRPTELKFREEVEGKPKEDCYITVNTDNMNVNTSGEYPVCWVKGKIEKIEPLGTLTEEQIEKNRAKLNDYFGE